MISFYANGFISANKACVAAIIRKNKSRRK